MNFVIGMVILFLSLFLGATGFSQIVGTLKYIKNFNKISALLTVTLWIVILGFGAFAVTNWLSDYSTILYIGYIISFLLSLKTKPDNEIPYASNESLDFTNSEITDFLGDILFDEDTSRLKSFLLELDEENKLYFIEQIKFFIKNLKSKFSNAGFVPEEITDLENRFNQVLEEIKN